MPESNALGGANSSFLERLVEEKDDFHRNRWRCVRYPDRAAETLSPCTQLDLTVVSARRLLAWTPSHTFEPPSNPYVKAFLDDKKVFETSAVRSPLPRWSHEGSIEFLAPHSMVRLQVMDHDSLTHVENVGFVEFRLGDLPWGKVVEGWLELRFHDMLERTSLDRYALHSSMRDDEVDERHEVRQSLLRSNGCMSCNRAPRMQKNAGEVLVRLHLLRLGSWLDSVFALALEPPAPKRFAVKPGPQPKKDELPLLDVQELRDDITDIKVAIVDGAFASIANFLGYILQWRSALLSTVVLVAFVSAWAMPLLTWVVIPALLAVLLLLLSSVRVRRATTIGGLNAPLSQEGFERVARWRSTSTMARFLRRVVEQDLQGLVSSEQELATCAAHCFSNGKPRVSYQQLREGLRGAKWTSATKESLSPGALVLVSDGEQSHRAKVQNVAGGAVHVKFDDGPSHSVRSFQVTPRPQAPPVPTWIFPEDLGTQIRMVELQVQGAKKRLLQPIQKITRIITWKRPCVALGVVVFLLAVSTAEATVLLGVWGSLPSEVGGKVVMAARVAMKYVKASVRICFLVVTVVFLVHCAPIFVEIRSITKICVRLLLTMRRRAPKNWPFFREDVDVRGKPLL